MDASNHTLHSVASTSTSTQLAKRRWDGKTDVYQSYTSLTRSHYRVLLTMASGVAYAGEIFRLFFAAEIADKLFGSSAPLLIASIELPSLMLASVFFLLIHKRQSNGLVRDLFWPLFTTSALCVLTVLVATVLQFTLTLSTPAWFVICEFGSRVLLITVFPLAFRQAVHLLSRKARRMALALLYQLTMFIAALFVLIVAKVGEQSATAFANLLVAIPSMITCFFAVVVLSIAGISLLCDV